MTDSLFFDTDCISAFLWVNEQSLLHLLYPGRVAIPKPVYDEISYPSTPHLKQRIDYMMNNRQIILVAINVDSETYALYQKLTTNPDKGHKIIGPGEAASIALAKTYNGIVASNNLNDIGSYICEYGLRHLTTGDILIEALNKDLITEDDGNAIWASMLAKRRKLGAASFSDYIKLKSVK